MRNRNTVWAIVHKAPESPGHTHFKLALPCLRDSVPRHPMERPSNLQYSIKICFRHRGHAAWSQQSYGVTDIAACSNPSVFCQGSQEHVLTDSSFSALISVQTPTHASNQSATFFNHHSTMAGPRPVLNSHLRSKKWEIGRIEGAS
jgi:hypothetical protein